MARRRARFTRRGSTVRFEGPPEAPWGEYLAAERRWKQALQAASAAHRSEAERHEEELELWEPLNRRYRQVKDRWGYAYLGLVVAYPVGVIAAYRGFDIGSRLGDNAVLITGLVAIVVGWVGNALYGALVDRMTRPLHPGPRPREPRLDVPSLPAILDPLRYGPMGLNYRRWEALCEWFGGCAYCGYVLKPYNYEIEHVLPRSRGGPHHILNVVPACAACNEDKFTSTGDEYAARREALGSRVNPAWYRWRNLEDGSATYDGFPGPRSRRR